MPDLQGLYGKIKTLLTLLAILDSQEPEHRAIADAPVRKNNVLIASRLKQG
jgi:hypothetical protein